MKRTTMLPLALGLSVLGAACAGPPGGAGSPSEVVAAAYPFTYLTERVAGETTDVGTLTPTGADPHEVELDPQEVASVQEASMVVYASGLQPAVDDALEQVGDQDAALDVLDVVTPIRAVEDGHDHAGDEHAGEDEHAGDDEHAGEDEHSGESGVSDPHVWLDPVAMVAVTERVRDRLSEIDPDRAETYADNAERLSRDLLDLDEQFRTGLRDCERRSIVTSHAAFGYLAARYDLEQRPVSGIDPTQEPSPQQLAEITDVVEREGITTVFTERLVDSSVAETIAAEAGVEIAVLDTIEGLSEETKDEDYLSLMEQNLQAISEANGCR